MKAGTNMTPPASGTLSARDCTWLLAEMALLLLGYVGSRFVFEVLLQRGTA